MADRGWVVSGLRAIGAAGLAFVLVADGVEAQTERGESAQERPTRSMTIVGVSPPPPGTDGRLAYELAPVAQGVEVDGRLDDPGWENAVVIPLPWEVSPAENGSAPVETECRLTQDSENL